MRRAPLLLLFVVLSAVSLSAADTVIFGPRFYLRLPGAPFPIIETFVADSSSTAATLKIVNVGVTNAIIRVNGVVVAQGSDFFKPLTTSNGPSPLPDTGTLVPYIEKAVKLRAGRNFYSVELFSRPGTFLLLAFVKSTGDTAPPIITTSVNPPPNANGWNNTNVTVSFTCSDAGSGIATCPAPVSVTSETAGQLVSGTATDQAGNSASASVTVRIDKTAPVVAAAVAPPANGNGWNNGPVTVTFTASDALSGVVAGSLTQPAVLSADGNGLSATGVAMDLAGNIGSATASGINIDQTPPTITAVANPPANASGWNNTPVTVHFVCTDAGSGAIDCPSDQAFNAEGRQSLAGTATDRAGNTATATGTVNIDLTPPFVAISSPVDSTTVFGATAAVGVALNDSTSSIRSVTCNGATALVVGAHADCTVSLNPGANTVAAVATDLAGNTNTASISVTYQVTPHVTITAPADLSYVNISPTTVTGTVDDQTATVTINSVAAPVVNGAFSLALPLAEGPNLITATSATPTGATSNASVTVTLDTTPPHVTITSPPDGFVTGDAQVSIAGSVNDIVVGTVNDQQAQVTVAGLNAAVANRTFLAATVPLAIGPNVIQAVARDRVGNAATTQVTIIRQPLTTPQIHLVSGNNQTAVIGGGVGSPIVVSLTDALGQPAANQKVIFKVTQNDGTVAAGGTPAPTVIATTDSQGRAQANWTLGHRSGAGGNVVEAYSVGFDGTAIFTGTGTQGAAGKIVVDTGNDQIGAISAALPKPFIAVVVDNGNNRLGNVPVTFSVRAGGGSLAGNSDVTVFSDSDGRAAATLTLGQQEGNANNVVEATFPGNSGFAAAFTASGRALGNPQDTAISGVVLDNSNHPIPGVTIRAVLTDALHSSLTAVSLADPVPTDAQGQFLIPHAPVGFVKLLVDGSTAQTPGVFPSLEYDLVTVAGQLSTVGQPIYLLPLNTANQLCVTPTSGGGTLTIPEAPGFSLTFEPGQVTFPGGSKTGCVSVTVVNGDKVPMVPGFGQQPRFIVTIQPSGAVFNPPAPITLPNVDGLQPRAVTEMYSFDHDIGSFVAIGTGVVSDDGLLIRSTAGVGVLKAGWHCGGDPSTTGTAADCPQCQKCTGTSCVTDDSASCDDGRFCTSADGKEPGPDKCTGGSCQGKPIEGEVKFKAEVDFAKIAELKENIKKISEIASEVTKWMPCWIGGVDPTVTLSEEEGKFCCEDDKKMADGHRLSGGGGVSVGAGCFIGLTSIAPELPPDLISALGLQAKGEVGVTGTVSDLLGTCTGDQFAESVELKGSVTVSVVIVHVGDLVDAHLEGPQGTLSAKLTAENLLSNVHFTGTACIDGEVKLIVETFGLKFEVVTFSLFGKHCI